MIHTQTPVISTEGPQGRSGEIRFSTTKANPTRPKQTSAAAEGTPVVDDPP